MLLPMCAAMLLAACETPPQATYVAQRGYLNVERVQTSSQIAVIAPSEQTVIRDHPPEIIRANSWAVVVPAPATVPMAPAVTLATLGSPEPLMSTPPEKKKASKIKKQALAIKPKAKPADCKPGEERS
ncbi:hypothetical protein [Noviherbaspirillum galbum]|uniref:hypothetical protein n=1 Tax=Noviherbaspirillum galbum TaxID=2709383 RepID=UPI00196A194E|nr:hypothetical protein [Noviherbaspirillum galbum]